MGLVDGPLLAARRRRGERSQHDAAFAISHSSFANPTPVGFMSLSVSAFAVALVNFGAHGVTTSTYLAAPAIWVGGLGQLLTGEFRAGGKWPRAALTVVVCWVGRRDVGGKQTEGESRIWAGQISALILSRADGRRQYAWCDWVHGVRAVVDQLGLLVVRLVGHRRGVRQQPWGDGLQ